MKTPSTSNPNLKMKYAILGGGIAGLTTAIALQKIGIYAQVFEAAADIKPLGAGLLLAANAVQAYERLGIAQKIAQRGRSLPSFEILDERGRIITQADATEISRKYGLHNFAIHRADLHEALLAELSPWQITTGKRAIGFEKTDREITIRFQDGTSATTEHLIVADGIHSAIRRQLLPDSAPRYAGYTCWRAVIDAGDLELSAATETWGTEGRFGIVPLEGNRIYWFACLNAAENDTRLSHFTVEDLQRHFGHYHTPVAEILSKTKDADLIRNDIADLKPLDRFAFGNMVLIGDAAHATTPNLGQGACQAIEDAVVLADELKKTSEPAVAFRAFEQRRLKRTQYIVNNSRALGRVAQLSNPMLAAARNTLFRLLPASANERQMRTLYKVDF
ncbi:MAG TPA: FAD-dependent monooxygenase [Saprospiraceae bacterium]|nr:FAD-dependent monooxygenase [Saprospiraceae bacterium]HPI06521.1 FAD-dependent monooxygenase [Saprospiraceae bacterium]